MENKIRFLISRLRNASFAELTHRIREEALVFRNQHLVCYGEAPLPIPSLGPEGIASLIMPSCVSSVPQLELEGFLHGTLRCLNTDAEGIRGFEARVKETYFSRIDQLQDDPDIRAVWEPARLQHVMALLLHAQQHNPASEFAAQCRDYAKNSIFEWIKNNPFLYGPHYKSVMECGLRVPLFFSALKYLSLDKRETDTILSTIYHHAWWIEKRLSLYSSIGNHTVCECVGLVFAGAVFRKTADGLRWVNKGVGLLRQELGHQILPDGGPIEQSLTYHRFVLDIYWLVVDFLEKNDLIDCNEFKHRLLQGEKFLAAFDDKNGVMPSIGDSDDGFAVAPGISPLRGAMPVKKKKFHHFPETGYSVIRLDNGTMVTFDHGPLGMAPLYNHGHADALSIAVTKNGEQILVDPGTYRYNGVPEWRKYFKGTRAHNTVTIDGLDQAVQETGFIWSKPFTTELLRSEMTDSRILLDAVHDGYVRLKQPVEHRRTILVADDVCLLIKDSFFGKGIHKYELNFHLHPEVATDERDGWWHLQKGASRVYMTLLGSGTFNSVYGQETPILGWYSPAYGIKQKSKVLQYRKKGHPEDVSFVTAVCLEGLISFEKLEGLVKSL